jgi:hypothetical protein
MGAGNTQVRPPCFLCLWTRGPRVHTLSPLHPNVSSVYTPEETTSGYPVKKVLDRVRSFLPQLADSNAALSLQSQDDIDIENIGDDQEQYIEMVGEVTFSTFSFFLLRLLVRILV